MSEIGTLVAQPRDRVGKGSSRAARRAGLVPAVIYGLGKPPVSITLPFNIVNNEMKKGRLAGHLFNLDVDGTVERVIPRDIQVDVVMDFPIHIDFLRLAKDAKVEVEVPVHFRNEEASPGLKRGGVLNIVRHDVALICPAEHIPESIDVDLTGLDIGDAVHITNIKLPEGVTPAITDRDFTIATIAAPSGGVGDESDEEAAEETEGEGE
ncbi:50S ribosomal protein L25/general stress protein Ctc [Emcibacter sp. SYSU 3D8]|uniref:50S ribosomal protein L25/general stress protein Ctc n=1 Tax=Emcibacter sp. SYSU 3D8 TaxID=3133969 RepID=UPI0031FEAA22